MNFPVVFKDTLSVLSYPRQKWHMQRIIHYIYLLYSGKNFRDAGMDAFKAHVIYQLSWNGKPINKFETDYPLTNFCVSDNDDVLYALADKGEVELVQYTLK